ncbi:uncharacterized protein [Anabrus simplex]|uniref:uncharacterized protein isoform X2 n=1 Tax=Anabrus simplex TaxID=316456 RepID=UPI0035A3A326
MLNRSLVGRWGKYAAVRRCRNRSNGEQFAAKFLRKRRRSTDLRPEILHEVAILDACRTSPRIVRLHQVFETSQEMILLLELAPGGELQMLLDRDEVPEEREVRRLMRQILAGLIDLHSINVAHLDIKPQNLVLTGKFPFCEVKLCDLGISRYISEATDIRDILGTPDYVAPEVLNYEPISLATDMWSVGVLMYVLLTGCSPFGGDTKQETFCNISLCNLDFPEDLFEDVSEDAKDLMRNLMVKEPSKRLTAQQCLEHPWFNTVDTATLQPVPSVTLPTSRATSCTLTLEPALPKKQESASEISSTKPTLSKRFCQSSVSLSAQSGDDLTVNVGNKSENSKDEKKDVESNLNERNSSGMRSFRRNTFRRNMGNLVERINSIEDAGKENTNIVLESVAIKPAPRLTTSSKKIPAPETPAANTNASFVASRPVNKTTTMQTVLINGNDRPNKSEVQTTTKKQQTTSVSHISTESVVRRRMLNKDCVYQFRRCYIIDDSEDDTGIVSPVNSLVSDGTNDSETSSGYFDNSSCCSSSDSVSDVSETSVDSTGDRLSTASIEDSLDYNYPKNSRQRFASNTTRCFTTQNRNLWQAREGREFLSTSSSFSLTLSRFNSVSADTQKPTSSKTTAREGFLTTPRKQPAKAAHTSIISKLCMSSVLTSSEKNSTGMKDCGINITRERNGNEVVLREVKGGRCSRFSEVKIESVQSRIRKFEN